MNISLFLNTVFLAIIAFSVVFIYRDAEKYAKSGVKIINPLLWAFLTLISWLPVFPLYFLFRRYNYKKQLSDPNFKPTQKFYFLVVFLLVAFFLASSVFFIAMESWRSKRIMEADRALMKNYKNNLVR